jgi:propanol-preferring alcohol dehydrogenase
MTLPDTMQALRLVAWGEEPELVRVPVPRPGPGELLLRVEAAGLCHSDLHVIAGGGRLPYALPFTLGHEVAGTVAAVGAGVYTAWLDEPVAVHGVWSCGRCRRCRQGRDNSCLRLTGPVGCGLGYDGGLAEFMLVPSERFLVKADGVAAVELAPLTDAGLTAYHAVTANLDVLAGEAVVLVVGVGGLGHLAIQVLRSRSRATVVAADPRESARALALRHGADLVVADLALVAAALDGQAVDAEGGIDLVLDFVGSAETLRQGADLLAPGGRLVVVGSAGGELVASKAGDLPRDWQLSAPFWGTRTDLEAVVEMAASGHLAAESETGTLADAPELYRRLSRGEIRGRAVVVPDRSPAPLSPARAHRQH